jgi:transposase
MTLSSKVRFKATASHQIVLFPANLDEKIPKNHPVRIVNQIVDHLNIDDILAGYKGGGTSSYHPRMMLKVLFYSYFCNIYSCRKIENLLNENIYFMWLSGNSTPNFRTINDFRGKRLKDKIQSLFGELIRLMAELDYVSLDVQYIDGTKIEAGANKYTFVWKKSVERYKGKLEDKISGILKNIDTAIELDESACNENQPNSKINSDVLASKIEELNKRIKSLSKPQQKQVKKLQKEDLPRLKKYEDQLEVLGERNSYSKTDQDATFMRMKDDHMKNGQLKAAYNAQISTENQFITNFSLHQRPGDTATLIPHLEQFEQLYGKQSEKAVTDAGYGSEENYHFTEQNDIEAFIKYNYFHKEQKAAYKEDPFLPSNLYYNALNDFLICPMGQKMSLIGTEKRKTDLGFESLVHRYQARNCGGCPLRAGCFKAKGNRVIELNHRLNEYRRKARERLLSKEGIKHRGKRPIEPEAVFGQIKYNNRFNRFTLKGLDKVQVEFGLVAISHNLRKIAQIIFKNQDLYSIFIVVRPMNIQSFDFFKYPEEINQCSVNWKIAA